MTASWLCRDDTDRERLLDMERHLQPVRLVAMGLIAVGLLVSAPYVGLWTLIPLALVAGVFRLADARLEHSARPEYLMFAAWTGSVAIIAGAVALSGGPDSPGTVLIAIPVVTLSARFSLRGVVLGVLVTLGLLAAVTFGVDAATVLDKPTLFVAPTIVVLSVAILSTALMRSDMHHRGEAVVDQLTGMLNRKALADRAGELKQQSEITGQPVGMIIGDLDHFKRINDSLGHATGDAVLKDVAYRLRKRMRAFDLAYRIGGEEFLVLLPGANLDETAALAEDLRQGVETEALGGIGMTMSFGVSASSSGTRFDYEKSFAEADRALYEAKRSGRNRVCTGTAATGEGLTARTDPVTAAAGA